MSKISCTILRTSSQIVEKSISKNTDINNLSYDDISNIIKKKGKGDLERHCDYDMGDYIISLFGWKSGKSSDINKTELPPPEDTDIYYGDIIFIKSVDKNNDYDKRQLVNLTKEEYKDFIEKAFGGFESLGETDTESDAKEDKYDSDDSFIVNSDEIDSSYEEEEEEEEEFISEEETSEDEDWIPKDDSNESDDETDSTSSSDKKKSSDSDSS